jgi:hypothetical protein
MDGKIQCVCHDKLIDQIDMAVTNWHTQIQDADPNAGDNLKFDLQIGPAASGQLEIEGLLLSVNCGGNVYVSCEIFNHNNWRVQIGRDRYTSDSDMGLLHKELAQLCSNCELELQISFYVFVNILSRVLADLGGIRWYDMESTRECLRTLASADHPRLGAEAVALKKISGNQDLLKRIGLFAYDTRPDGATAMAMHRLIEFAEIEIPKINRILASGALSEKWKQLKYELTVGIERCFFVMRCNAFGQTCMRSGVSKTPGAEELLTPQYFLSKIEADADFVGNFLHKTFPSDFYANRFYWRKYVHGLLKGQIKGHMAQAETLVRICNNVLAGCEPASLPIWYLILAGERRLLLNFVQDNREVFEKYLATRNAWGIALFHQIFISFGQNLTDITFLSKYYGQAYKNITSIVRSIPISTNDIAYQLQSQVPCVSSKNPNPDAVQGLLTFAQELHNPPRHDEPPPDDHGMRH